MHVYAWGDNTYGELGNNGGSGFSNVPVAVSIPGGITVTAIAAGGAHDLALTSTGSVYAWGDNTYGELGNGSTNNSGIPLQASLPSGVTITAIAAGAVDSLALTSTGTVYAWGYNLRGEMGNGTTSTTGCTCSDAPVAVTMPSGVTFTAIASGNDQELALTSDGTVYGWGNDDHGQVDGTPSGAACFCVNTPTAVSLPGGAVAVAITGGVFFSTVATQSSGMCAWGDNVHGQLGLGDTTVHRHVQCRQPGTGSRLISADGYHAMALFPGQAVNGWGDNTFGEQGRGSVSTTGCMCVDQISPQGFYASTPVGIATGFDDDYALMSTGVWASGRNDTGQLGDGSTSTSGCMCSPTPVQVSLPPGTTASAIAAGNGTGLALTTATPTATTTVVSGSPNPSTVGQVVTYTGTVSPVPDGGTIAFADNSTTLAGCGAVTVNTSTGQASCTTTYSSAGSHGIQASYSGDSSYAPSSGSLTEQVNVATTVQDSSPAVSFDGWVGASDPGASGGTDRSSATKGATASFRFSGTGVTWVTRTGPDQGIAGVTIDGVSKGNVDLYAATTHDQVSERFAGLSSARHRIIVKVTGTKNAASTGTAVALDSLIVDPTTWTHVTPATSPPARSDATMAYDNASSSVVLFGGTNGGYLGDTWTWNGATWTQQIPATSPPARQDASMAYDSASGSVVLFGGFNGSGWLGDTWTWDGTTWTQQTPATSPSARNAAAIADDSASGSVVLFGGFDGSSLLGDTWTWDGTTWTQQTPATSPPGRSTASMADDSANGSVVLFGGGNSGGDLGDTWTWNGTTWTQRAPATSPPARGYAPLAYDSARGHVVLFGGSDGTNALGDTWAWNGSTWTQQTPAASPSARAAAAMAYDSGSSSVVLLGGSGTTYLNDTWMWSGTTTQDSSTKVAYDTWAGATSASASGGTYRVSGKTNATCGLSFSGTSVQWMTATGPAYGEAEVIIDGVNQGTVDLYSSGVSWQVAKTYSGLASGPHTIVVKVLGIKNASSTGTKVVVDAFVVS